MAECVKSNVIYVFIDASNLWQAQKAKGKFLNWEKVIKYIKERLEGTDIKFFFYDAYPAEGTRRYNLDGKHKFYTYLQKALKKELLERE